MDNGELLYPARADSSNAIRCGDGSDRTGTKCI